ncbi:MAG: hypothetical protein A2157_05435 [Deltaproteobacteria bacterium RBG_16_47_11]|nr:MAG: hypothetical protein A2157_05435 [Deltaproteobacteria bacterium RBG_16_47_11]
MRETIKTLLIDANGLTLKSILADTLLKGTLGLSSAPPFAARWIPYRIGQQLWGRRNESLSYVLDWREAICEAKELDADICNITNLIEYREFLRKLRQYPLIIVLHSATGDSMSLLRKRIDWFRERRGKLVVFVGNEYNLLGDKINFLKSVKADYICSQLPLEVARWLYEECVDSQILSLPHGLNPKVYFPVTRSVRKIDIGFIGDFYHHLVGDKERTHLVQFFQEEGKKYKLTCDIRSERLPRLDWAEFLRSCNGILGAESGTYYLDRKGRQIEEARRYFKTHRGITFDEVHHLFFSGVSHGISGKAISSRHFEPIGTKTCQILIEGTYNGILKGDEHYISLKKDLSNIEDVMRRFMDEEYRSSMVNRAYEDILSSHTYRHRVDSLLKTVVGDIPTR